MPYKDPAKRKAYHTEYNKAHYAKNKPDTLARNKAWREANPERKLQLDNASRRKRRAAAPADTKAKERERTVRRYGITVEEYHAMLAAQDYACAICGTKPDEGQNLHIDHCHDTEKVRGLLCSQCNTGIGLLKHNPDTLIRGAEYLRKAA